MFSATEYFFGQSVCVGATLPLPDVFYRVSRCEERDGLLRAVFGQCHRTPAWSLEELLMVSFTLTGIFCILPVPSVLSSGLLP